MKKNISRRAVIAGAGALGLTLGVWPHAYAQSKFPEAGKTIKGIVPLAAGSTVDALARLYAQEMSGILGTNIVIDNRPGAEGLIGVQAVLSAPTDGYTILFASISTAVINPHLFKQLPYSPSDFAPLGGTMRTPLMMTAGPEFPFQTVAEFVAAAKAEPRRYTFGSVSSTTRLSGEMFAKAAGIELVNVPYKAFTDMISDTLANRVNFFFADPSALKNTEAQGMRGLGIASKTRAASFPDVQTMDEQGFELEIIGYHSAYVRAGTAPEVLAILRDALSKAEGSEAVGNFITNSGNEIMHLNGDAFAEYEMQEYERWGRVIKDAGLAGTL